MPGEAREPSGRRRLLVANRLVLPICWTAARTVVYSRAARSACGLYLNDPPPGPDPRRIYERDHLRLGAVL
jgi:hypothetical protein